MPHFILSGNTSRAPLRVLDARPDDTDANDYIFRPSLLQLPDSIDNSGFAPVLDQGSEGACVGFALATVINVSYKLHYKRDQESRTEQEPVSYRMLYEMGRRYDEWQGENYEGTSLRGAMKGWHRHGVSSEKIWPYKSNLDNGLFVPDRAFTPERASDALRRPLGAYYRIIDSDISHMQAALLEGDAVLASAWVHPGWQHERLLSNGQNGLKSISAQTGKTGLHAFAIVGFSPDGFIIQNSWGEQWGSQGYAVLSYEDWFENRQDAWVARPGPETHDSSGSPQIYLDPFAGGTKQTTVEAAQIVGMNLDPEVRSHLINTGDEGKLSSTGRLYTDTTDLKLSAQKVLTSTKLADDYHHVVLYAHGGLNNEEHAASVASRLFENCKQHHLHPYFFIWETGIDESFMGWLRSNDDALGPARFSWKDTWDNFKEGAGELMREAQQTMGKALAPIVREVFWDEMKRRAQKASTQSGGASLFMLELIRVMSQTPDEQYKIHLIGHSAGSIYLAWLYQNVLAELLQEHRNVSLHSIHFLAPAITIERAQQAFKIDGKWAVPKERFHVHTLSDKHENSDSIVIYPSSLLTYVADHLESDDHQHVDLLGIRSDFNKHVDFATGINAEESWRHGQFDDKGHEIEDVFKTISSLSV